MLALGRAWRVALLALLVHYAAVGGLAIEVGSATWGGLHILTGSLVCLVLFLTVRRRPASARLQARETVSRQQASQLVFRLAAAGLAGIGVFGTSIPGRFPSLPPELVLASTWLMTIGLVIVLVAQDRLWAGMGVLTAQSGFATLYTILDSRLMTTGILAASGLVLALVVAIAVTPVNERQLLDNT
ncbi:MAG: hypothetical protein D6791_03740 [Chloroflexi bacterium]|nr:MAG: hypothetical protein D6791_03740 [Chloroflexota bacterium]